MGLDFCEWSSALKSCDSERSGESRLDGAGCSRFLAPLGMTCGSAGMFPAREAGRMPAGQPPGRRRYFRSSDIQLCSSVQAFFLEEFTDYVLDVATLSVDGVVHLLHFLV